MERSYAFYGNQAIIYTRGEVPQTAEGLIRTGAFRHAFLRYMEHLRKKDSPLLGIFPKKEPPERQDEIALGLLGRLAVMTGEEVAKDCPEFAGFFRDTYLLNQFIENFYNYWRSFERFLICYSDRNHETPLDKRPYTTFNETIEFLNHLVRKVYRDMCEHATGEHPRVYRQLPAGCQVGMIAAEGSPVLPRQYAALSSVPVIRQVLIVPPLIFDPPMNKRTGTPQKIGVNPLKGMEFGGEWLCYPAKVGELVINIYFHHRFMDIGTTLANIFDLASDDDIRRKPDAVYAFGMPLEKLKGLADPPTVFYDDEENDILVAAVPGTDDFGYFGYLKKLVLTLHNVSVMKKRGRMPVHGAMVRIMLKDGKSANIVIWGDTGAGKSETIEAFRVLAGGSMRDMSIVFDDMGSLELDGKGRLRAFGTETGAFVRLDDLRPGFAFGNIDRSIISSPQKANTRVALPVTTLHEITGGHPVDFLLYANNYDHVDDTHPVLERFAGAEQAMEVFRKGARIAKGTTGGESGLVYSYFSNIFGPVQYRELHERIAKKHFRAAFDTGVFVGQLRTMLGVPGFETKGPDEAAAALIKLIAKK